MLDQPIPMSLDDLISFGIDDERGFLPPKDPMGRLSPGFAPWEDVAHDIGKLIVAGRLRSAVDGLPRLSVSAIEDERAARRAMLVLSYLGHAYVWSADRAAEIIPETIAVPWVQLAQRLGRPPILSYASYALDNWRRIDPDGPIEIENLAIVQNFLGGADEDWFILIHVEIEARAAPAIRAIPAALGAVARDDADGLAAELSEMEASLAAMIETLRRMPEFCDPYVYFHRVRPYIHGWKDNPAVPDGVVYEGVGAYGGVARKFRGETGAQSGIIPAIDAALGIVHEHDRLRVYLMEMRDYMPPGHRAFVEAVEDRSAIRRFVQGAGASDRSLLSAYDSCLRRVEEFRSIHLEYAARYIFRQAGDERANPNSVGTGGTPFMPYLKKHRDETRPAPFKQEDADENAQA
ncbi:MAG: hypothetical protein O7A66_12010 [Alphaproteobacteria bacterium]|nr:hypothetical protein [Alphaproteobacteria bacterium]